MSRPVTPGNGGVVGSSRQATGTLSRSNSQRSGTMGVRTGSYMAGGQAPEYAAEPHDSPALSEAGEQHDTVLHDNASGMQRPNSQLSQTATAIPSRGGTLKKKSSLKRGSSLKRSGSNKSSYAGSVRSMRLGEKEKYDVDEEHNSAFYCPVPTTGSPTELLADRFQAWRKVLKDLISYFRDLQKSYDSRVKSVHSAANVLNNITSPPNFQQNGGIADATSILRDFHKLTLNESSKSKELENEVILQLTGLRSDLQQKIKEIKSLSGDFKNSVGKEQDATRKAVRALHEALGSVDHDVGSTAGRGDPFLVKQGVDRQLERQIEEENYLHRAYLNLEASGRELESIVVGEIQKAYNVLAGILNREATHSFETAQRLREGPIALPKDSEWDNFVTNNTHMVDPRVPLRQYEQITYTGKDHPAALEVRSGMLERKSKYLKNYTPGWYVLSPTHLHEFKSADRINNQAPVMSLYLPEQKLGTHSEPGSNSNKFMLKGRQTGTMHRGHSWIFRAETHDTMLAWYADIKELTERTGEARNEFVRRSHARSLSASSVKAPSINSAGSGMEDDEADQVAFSTQQSLRGHSLSEHPETLGNSSHALDGDSQAPSWRPQRPKPGGRFPSDLNVQRGLQAPLSPSSGDSVNSDRDLIAAAGALPGSGIPFVAGISSEPHTDLQQSRAVTQPGFEWEGAAVSANDTAGITSYTAGDHHRVAPTIDGAVPVETASTYGEWMAPLTAAAGAAVVGGTAGTAYAHEQNKVHTHNTDEQQNAIPAMGESSAPIAADVVEPVLSPVSPIATVPDTTKASAHNAATIEQQVGVNAPAPTQVLASARIPTNDTVSDPVATDARPALHHSAKSVQTISDLHVPGEFPKNLPA